jgi:hypothetical protein
MLLTYLWLQKFQTNQCYGQIGAGYLFDLSFQEAYLERGVDCYVDFLDEVPSASQIKKDSRVF